MLAGILAGFAGLATSYAAAMVLTIRESPVVAVAELVIKLTPGAAAERAISVLGQNDKPALVAGILVILLAVFGGAGLLARRRLVAARAWCGSPSPASVWWPCSCSAERARSTCCR